MAGYATVAQLVIRAQIRSVLDEDATTMLEEILDGASRAIDRACHREDNAFVVPTVASDKYFPAEGTSYLRVDGCVEIDTVAVKNSYTDTAYVDWTTPSAMMAGDGDWVPAKGDPTDPTYNVTPYDLILIDINGDYTLFPDGGKVPVAKVTAKWGAVSTAPGDIREACVMQASKWLKQMQGSMAASLGTAEFGEINYRRGLDTEVRNILLEGGWILPLYGGA